MRTNENECELAFNIMRFDGSNEAIIVDETIVNVAIQCDTHRDFVARWAMECNGRKVVGDGGNADVFEVFVGGHWVIDDSFGRLSAPIDNFCAIRDTVWKFQHYLGVCFIGGQFVFKSGVRNGRSAKKGEIRLATHDEENRGHHYDETDKNRHRYALGTNHRNGRHYECID